MTSNAFIPAENTLISRIQKQVSISEYIGQTVNLKESQKTKGESSGKCPFHDDSNPSFGVSESKGVFLCRGCGKTGNVVTFRALLENRDYDDVKKDFARELGFIKNEELSIPLKLLDHTSRKYSEAILSREQSLQYLANRGITKSTIEKFRLGFCYGNEFDRASAERLGNALLTGILTESKNKGDRPYNQMAGRITFPIRNKDGLVVGFGGRRMDDRPGPKYLNTSETEYFKKSEILFGFHEARSAISMEKHAIVVEGYMDTVVLHQESITNAVGVMGSSAGSKTFEMLWRSTKRIVFCLDPDKAGQDGTLRSIYQAANDMTDECVIEIASLPDKIDPDEFVLKHGAAKFKEVISNAIPLSIWLCQLAIEADEDIYSKDGFNIAENRSRYLRTIEGVALRFSKAPALQLEIQRQAHAILNAFVIHAALKQENISASEDEIKAALDMMHSFQKKLAPVTDPVEQVKPRSLTF